MSSADLVYIYFKLLLKSKLEKAEAAIEEERRERAETGAASPGPSDFASAAPSAKKRKAEAYLEVLAEMRVVTRVMMKRLEECEMRMEKLESLKKMASGESGPRE